MDVADWLAGWLGCLAGLAAWRTALPYKSKCKRVPIAHQKKHNCQVILSRQNNLNPQLCYFFVLFVVFLCYVVLGVVAFFVLLVVLFLWNHEPAVVGFLVFFL